jgi:hypothetical protein
MSRIIGIDFETFYIKGEYSIKDLGAETYVRHPRFDPYLISVTDGTDVWSGPRNQFNWDALQGGNVLLSHNAGFDRRVHAEMVRRGWAPPIDFKAWHCTANLTTFLAMRRDLERATEYLLGLKVDKSYRQDADGKTWDQMVAEGVSEKVMEAGRVDVIRCWQFFAKFGHLWPELERKLSDMTVRQCMRGCAMNLEELDRQLISAQKALILADSILPWVASGRKPTSPKAIAEECRKYGIPAPPVKSKDGDEAYDEWAEQYQKYEWVKAYTDYRVINKQITTLETLKSRLHSDNIFPYDLLYFGAHTGRWAGSGGFNMQNMRKVPLYFDAGQHLITDAPRLKEIAKTVSAKVPTPLPAYVADSLDVRRLLVPRKGCRMMAPDLSQIEPRVLAWFVKDQIMLDLMSRGVSPYQAHAIATMGWKGEDMKKEDAELYALAKARVLGLGFGCGWRKFINVAMTMAGLDITVDDPEFVEARNEEGEICKDMAGKPIMISGYGMTSRRIVKEYREQNPLIAGPDGIWATLDAAFRDSVGKTFEMELPSGRVLRYPEVMRERKAVADPDRPGKWVTKTCFTALAFDQKRNGIVRKNFYGGLLTENLVQATARDIFGQCCVALDETPGINVLWTVHDEAVIEVEDPLITTDQVRDIMRRPVSWMPGLPIDCELEVIPHYKK